MKTSISILSVVLLATSLLPGGEPPRANQQIPDGPFVSELAAKQRDLTYEGLRKVVPTPAFRSKLDFDPVESRYFDNIKHELELTDEEIEIFRKHGFVAIENGRGYSFTTAYHDIYTSDLPVLVTTDSILQALHSSYDDILKELESNWFSWTMEDVLLETHIALVDAEHENENDDLTVNFRDVDLYLTMARKLLNGEGSIGFQPDHRPQELRLPIESQLGQGGKIEELLEKVSDLKLEKPFADPPTNIFGGSRYIDYSQFRPRGHYAESRRLQRYFRTMMWLGRADTGWTVQPIDPRTGGIIANDLRELRNAMLLVQLLRDSGSLKELQAIDRVLAYMVGNSDTLNFSRLHKLMQGASVNCIDDLADEGKVASLQGAIRKWNRGREHVASQILISDPYDSKPIELPTTFQVFGQRFAIDSYVLSKLVFDSIVFKDQKQKRMMPTGLDVMATMGNVSAFPLLEGEVRRWNYGANLLACHDFVAQQNDVFWASNLYSLWLDSLRKLDNDLLGERHAPQVMQTEAWQRKQLQTQLASWSQLRHDTVLYAGQSYSMVPGCEYLSGYVEPYPDFYASLKEFAERAHELIEGTVYRTMDRYLQRRAEANRRQQLDFFNNMATRMGQLEQLARKELKAEPFTGEEREFVGRTISKYGSAPLGSGSRPAYYGWYTELFYSNQPRVDGSSRVYSGLSKFDGENESSIFVHSTEGKRAKGKAGEAEPMSLPEKLDGGYSSFVRFGRSDTKFSTTISDVHTDPKSKQVLQVATGKINLCVIAIDNAGDRVAYVGPVFSYHEFDQPAERRLTNREWAEMLDSGAPPARPGWSESFTATPVARPKHGTFASVRHNHRTRKSQLELVTIPKPSAKEVSSSTSDSQELARTLPGSKKPEIIPFELTDSGLSELSKAPTLRSLDLSKAPITDAGLKHLAVLTDLRNLSLSGTQIDGTGLTSLLGAPWLRRVLLSDSGLTDEGLGILTDIPRLEILDLSGTPITNESIAHLKKMTSLRQLDLRKTGLDEAAVDDLRAALRACKITY